MIYHCIAVPAVKPNRWHGQIFHDDNVVVWTCSHDHIDPRDARSCARHEADRLNEQQAGDSPAERLSPKDVVIDRLKSVVEEHLRTIQRLEAELVELKRAEPDDKLAEPTEPGWYAYTGGAQVLIFHLRYTSLSGSGRQWSAHFVDGIADDCDWSYIAQALTAFGPLVPLRPAPVHPIGPVSVSDIASEAHSPSSSPADTASVSDMRDDHYHSGACDPAGGCA